MNLSGWGEPSIKLSKRSRRPPRSEERLQQTPSVASRPRTETSMTQIQSIWEGQYTEPVALMELKQEGAPVSVTLIKPGAIETPYSYHAKNYLDDELKHAQPVYAPDTVARTILHCAETPLRDAFVGAGGKSIPQYARFVDKVMDKVREMVFVGQQKIIGRHGLAKRMGWTALPANMKTWWLRRTCRENQSLHARIAASGSRGCDHYRRGHSRRVVACIAKWFGRSTSGEHRRRLTAR